MYKLDVYFAVNREQSLEEILRTLQVKAGSITSTFGVWKGIYEQSYILTIIANYATATEEQKRLCKDIKFYYSQQAVLSTISSPVVYSDEEVII